MIVLIAQFAYRGLYIADEGICWKDLATELDVPHHITCKPKVDSNLETFALKVFLNKNAKIKKLHVHSVPNYIVRLLPPLTVQNFLPYVVEMQNADPMQQIRVEPGEKSSVYSVNMSTDLKFALKVAYSGHVWTGNLNLTTDLDEKILILSSDSKSNGTVKQLLIHVRTEKENYCLVFYASYWIVNKTQLPLQIKVSGYSLFYALGL